jgi:hypothetical protein
MRKYVLCVALLVVTGVAEARGRRPLYPYQPMVMPDLYQPMVVPVSHWVEQKAVEPRAIEPKAAESTAKDASDALAEVNAAREARGLRPFAPDPDLNLAARGAAQYRARYLMAGHTDNDFRFLPEGATASAAGCAAWEPSLGWGACCTYDGYTYAGAAWSLGSDGRRYMHLFVR